MRHRADIDGLRAVAVLAVVAYHAFPDLLHGGFAGVDVFFVISGYLIGGILLKGIDRGQFSFRDFYARRIRRIFPALIIVLACCLFAGWRFMLPDEYKSLAAQAGAGAASFANVLLWMQTGYFDADANLKPLLHLWSLGVEEQFYLLWPLILFVIGRRPRVALAVTFLLGLVSFALNIWSLPLFPEATFFLPHTRIWELLAGCLLAHAEYFHPRTQSAAASNLKALTGALLIATAFLWLDSSWLYPGKHALLPVVGAVLLIAAGPTAFINRVLLGNRLMTSIGLISYPLYLWHWPLLSFERIYEQHAPSVEATALLVAAAFLLSILTYLLLERRIRYRKHVAVPVALASVMMLVGGQSFAVYRSNGFPERTARFEKVQKAVGEWDYPTKNMAFEGFEEIPLYGRKGGAHGTVLFMGDSNIEQYWPRIDQLLTDSPATTKSATFFTLGGCPAIPGVTEPMHPLCNDWTGKVRRYVASHPSIDTVVIGGYWVAYLDLIRSYVIDGVSTAREPGRTKALEALGAMISDFRHEGKRVIIVLNAPAGNAFDPRALVGRSIFGFSIKEGGMRINQLAYEKAGIHDRMAAMAHAAGAEVIDPADYLCSKGFCPAWAGDEPIYRDMAHVRATFVRSHATFIDRTVQSPSGITASSPTVDVSALSQ